MKILSIETSCDETSIAVLEIKNNKAKVLSNIVSSQVKIHAKYGGVVPNLAAREHVKNIGYVFKRALKEARMWDVKHPMFNIDLIAVTRGPGLSPALLVGITFAKTLAWKYNKPLVGVNHLEGHIYSNWLKPVGVSSKTQIPNSKLFPILNLIVSGGHTELILMKGHGEYELIGETLDDAVGEAFDKVARLLGLGYPGGHLISKLAEKGNAEHYPLPSPMIKSKDLNFSYSGLKTAVLYLLRDIGGKEKLTQKIKYDIAASFQKAALDVLVSKTFKAVEKYNPASLFLSGGVSANKILRETLTEECEKINLKYSQPELEYTGDNAAMIAMAGYFNYLKNKKTDWQSVDMDANLGFRKSSM